MLSQNEAYVYLRIHLVSSLKWKRENYTIPQSLSKNASWQIARQCGPQKNNVYFTKMYAKHLHPTFTWIIWNWSFFIEKCIPKMYWREIMRAVTDIGRLKKIYTGLTHNILAKCYGSENLTRIKLYNCIKSFITSIFFLLKTASSAHLKSKTKILYISSLFYKLAYYGYDNNITSQLTHNMDFNHLLNPLKLKQHGYTKDAYVKS